MPSPTNSSIPKRLFALAMPIIGLNVLNVLALAIDTAMLGHYDATSLALTALGFATQLVFLLMVVLIGLSVGTVGLVSRAHGAGDNDRVNHVLRQSTILTAFLGVAVALVGNLVAPQLLMLLGASDAVVEVGLAYLRPLLVGTVFLYSTMLHGAVMRGVGNTRIPFLVALLSTFVNTGLNVLLIYGKLGFPELGITGAAIGTVVSQCVSAALLWSIMRSGRFAGLRLQLRPAGSQGAPLIDRTLARQLGKIGAPAALDLVLLNVGFLALIGMLGRIAEDAVAAHGIGLRIQALAFVPGLGISQATAALVGQALGGGHVDRAHQVVRSSLWMCTLLMSTLAAIILMAAHPIVAIFDVSEGSQLQLYSIQWLYLLGACMPPTGFFIALVGLLQGSGATSLSLRINVLTTLAVQIPLAALLGFTFHLGAVGVWLAFPLSFVAKGALAWIAYKSNRWATVGLAA